MKNICLFFFCVLALFSARTFVDPANVRAIHFNTSAISEANNVRLPRFLHVVCIWPFEHAFPTTFVNESRLFCMSNMHESHPVIDAVIDCMHVPITDERVTSNKTIVQDSCRVAIRLGTFSEFLDYWEQRVDFSVLNDKQQREMNRMIISAAVFAEVYSEVFAGAHNLDYQIIEYKTTLSWFEKVVADMERDVQIMQDTSKSVWERNWTIVKFSSRILFWLFVCTMFGLVFATPFVGFSAVYVAEMIMALFTIFFMFIFLFAAKHVHS